MKDKKTIIIFILTIIILILIIVIGLFATKVIPFDSNTNVISEENTGPGSDQESVEKILMLNDTYTIHEETSEAYVDASVVITNQTDDSIDFNISKAKGTDKDHVNIGNVSGTATMIEKYKYEFKETLDGKTNIITFDFTNNGPYLILNITESYPDDLNPYGGNGIYFEGEYKTNP